MCETEEDAYYANIVKTYVLRYVADTYGENNECPLIEASRKGHVEVLKILSECGCGCEHECEYAKRSGRK